ncbi:MAG: DUF1573 domain-containing protein [Bacteroidetes bacterium]|nr:DUF1573 domain-containing protein [Bacteroidota bacterium]
MENNLLRFKINPTKKISGIFYLILLSFAPTFFFSQPKIKFKYQKQSFGFVKKGEIVTLKYPFKNIGTENIEIEKADVECTCTNIKYPSSAIEPGKGDTIVIVFDTKSAYDRQDRYAYLYLKSNSKPIKLRYKGVVLH